MGGTTGCRGSYAAPLAAGCAVPASAACGSGGGVRSCGRKRSVYLGSIREELCTAMCGLSGKFAAYCDAIEGHLLS